jgi:hypothetical protein
MFADISQHSVFFGVKEQSQNIECTGVGKGIRGLRTLTKPMAVAFEKVLVRLYNITKKDQ